jgi:hypothetical protein
LEKLPRLELAHGGFAHAKERQRNSGRRRNEGKYGRDNVSKVVIITNPEVTGTYFPSLDQATKEKMNQLFKSFIPPTLTISLHRLIASVPKQKAPTGVQLNNDPPRIFVGYRPSILLNVDGEPVLSEVPIEVCR